MDLKVDEDQNKAAIERANAYRQMFEMWAWKDFKGILDELRKDALNSAIYASNMDEIHGQRGAVKILDRIESELGFMMSQVS